MVYHLVLSVPLLADITVTLNRHDLFAQNPIVLDAQVRDGAGGLMLRVVLHVLV